MCATESKRTEPAYRAGMTVRHGMGCAGQHHAELRRDHVTDALLGVADVEQPNAVAAAALAHGAQKGSTRRIGVVVAAGLGRDRVVLHREREIGTPHRAALLVQLLEGVRRVQLVQYVPVDIDELAPIRARRHQVGVPNLVEQGLGHECRLAKLLRAGR
jgi:hypothetical protein